MRRLLVIAVLALAGTSVAQAAEHYSFEIGGRKVRIEVPNRCSDLSCIKVDIPGVNLGGTKDEDVPPLPKLPGQATTTPTTPAPAVAAPPSAPLPAATAAAPATLPPPPPAPTPAPAATTAAPPPPAPPAPVVTATAPSASASVQPGGPTILPGALMPVGTWQTEKNEGKVRIEQCGQNLCGWALEERTGAKGKQVLVDMKSTRENLWNGKINDVRSGSTYVSKMSLHGPNSLRVEGCAMGGMLCGGQTWVRIP
jgi:hypothetical protein